MSIQLSDSANHIVDLLELPITQVYETINTPAKKNIFDFKLLEKEISHKITPGEDMFFYLYAKDFEKYWLIVMVYEIAGEPPEIRDVIIVTDTMIPRIHEKTPIEMMEDFTKLFGAQMEVDGELRQIIITRRLEMTEDGEIQLFSAVRPPKGEICRGTGFARTTKDSAVLAMQYCINMTRYKERLFADGLVSNSDITFPPSLESS